MCYPGLRFKIGSLQKEMNMVYRALPFFVIVMALALFLGRTGLADETKRAEKGDTHEGTVVSVTGDKLIMKSKAKAGEEAIEHTHKLADNAKVTCDGKECKLEDLKQGQKIRVTTKKGDKEIAIKVEALEKKTRFGRDDDTDK